MFVLGDLWSFDIQNNGALAISLPEIHGKREVFLFDEHIWRNWLENDLVEPHSKQSVGTNDTINSSLLEIDLSGVAKILEIDVESLSDLFSTDWLSESQTDQKEIDSMCEDTQTIISTSGYEVIIVYCK